ncbi:MAG: hypothetical protein GC149_20315 [Gammaproteobacteria bacterium]|nr:hypothetical protein [Gammaproteobacteria bacterium]
MLSIAVASITGAIFNRVRGGMHGPLKAKLLFWAADRFGVGSKAVKVIDRITDGKVLNAAAFGLFCVIVHASEYKGIIGGVPVYVFAAGAFALFLYQFAMMLRGSAPGWGDYIGAAGGWRTDTPEKPLQEVDYIDRMIEPLKDRPVLWGIAGLSIRCGEWGLFIGAPLLTFWPLLAGLLAGPLCWVAVKIGKQRHGWEIFEALLGAALWVSVLFTGG